MERRVAITGMGIVTAHGVGKETCWAKTANGESGIRPVSLFDTARYRTQTAGEISDLPSVQWRRFRPSRMDRSSNILHAAFLEAVKEAGLSAEHLASNAPLCAIGTTLGGMSSGEKFHAAAIGCGSGLALPSQVFDHLAHLQPLHLMEEHGIPGIPVVFTNACASGANAVGYAFRIVRGGARDVAVCGGFDALCEFVFAGFHSLQALTPEVCRPFDRGRNGMILGEGAGVLVLESWDRAESRGARILGEVIGYGESTDAFHMTRPDPGGAGAAASMRFALADARVHPDAVGYINAHGTGTLYNDLAEAAAIRTVFGRAGSEVPTSSTKAMIGHVLGGAGAVEAILTVLALRNRRLPVNLNYHTPDPDCGLRVVSEPCTAPLTDIALSNSFGFGGSNASLVFRAAVGDGE